MAAHPGTLFECGPALTPTARRSVVLGVFGVHVVVACALLQLQPVREAVREAVHEAVHPARPLFVGIVAAPLPQPAVPVAAATPAPRTPAPHTPVPRTPDPHTAAPPVAAHPASPAPAPAPGPAPAPASLAPNVTALAVTEAGPAEPAGPAARAAQPVAWAAAAAAAAPPPPGPVLPAAPRAVATSAVRYVVEPEPLYSATSRRLGESGEVRLRVEIGTDGRARHVSVHHSSGFARLDESAIAAVRAARFAPYTEHGVALVVWTIVPIAFELQGAGA